MTIAVPTEAAEHLEQYLDHYSPASPPDFIALPVQAGRALIEFVRLFGTFALPNSTATVAGEMNELKFETTDLDAQLLDVIRVNGRVFVPEVIEAYEDEELIHLAGNGRRLTVDDVERVAQRLETHMGQAVQKDGARLLRFLGEILAGDPLERALDGLQSLTRKRDAEGGGIVATFEEPGQGWRLFQLLQSRLMSGEENPHA